MSQVQSQQVTGGLLFVLRYARRAWYKGPSGITAYYEQPSPEVPGALYINGQLITGLMVDQDGLFWDRPSPRVQEVIGRHGVSLSEGWTCDVRVTGSDAETAIAHSPWHIAQHSSGIAIHQVNGGQVIIFVNEQAQWSVPAIHLSLALHEMGASPHDGWMPSLGAATVSKFLPARVIPAQQTALFPCYGGAMIVPIEGDNPDKSGAIKLTLTVSGGYTAPMLQSIIPAIPGLADWKCHVNTNYGEVRTLKLFRNSYFFAPPSTGFVLDFSANVGRFPDGSVTIHTAAQVIQIARYAGLAGRAMRLGVSEGGYATTIDLLEIGWEQKYVYVS